VGVETPEEGGVTSFTFGKIEAGSDDDEDEEEAVDQRDDISTVFWCKPQSGPKKKWKGSDKD
jgi:hypothetical protein